MILRRQMKFSTVSQADNWADSADEDSETWLNAEQFFQKVDHFNFLNCYLKGQNWTTKLKKTLKQEWIIEDELFQKETDVWLLLSIWELSWSLLYLILQKLNFS